jgi:hypothetical protein
MASMVVDIHQSYDKMLLVNETVTTEISTSPSDDITMWPK